MAFIEFTAALNRKLRGNETPEDLASLAMRELEK